MRHLQYFPQQALVLVLTLLSTTAEGATPVARVTTVLGEIFIELTPVQSPATVENFLGYVRRGDYDGSFIHRAPNPNFVVQGGGFFINEETGFAEAIPAQPPVVNEFNVSNLRGTVAMAKLGGQPDSATNEWFVNIADNSFLDTQNGGFTVFGRVDDAGLAVADSIAALPTVNIGSPFSELPVVNFSGGTVTAENLVTVLSVEEFELLPAPATAILPGARTVQVGSNASVFATLINVGASMAASCRIEPPPGLPLEFSFQQTDPATNVPVGAANVAVDIAAGAAQSFVMSLTPTAPLEEDLELRYRCGNAPDADIVSRVNTIALTASTSPVADVIALAATPTEDGVLSLPGSDGAGAFSVATINVGATETVEISAISSAGTLPLNLFVCETNPASGLCLADPTPTLERSFTPNESATFSVFVNASGEVPFSPAENRVITRFRDLNGQSRGETSVAVSTTL